MLSVRYPDLPYQTPAYLQSTPAPPTGRDAAGVGGPQRRQEPLGTVEAQDAHRPLRLQPELDEGASDALHLL